VDFNTKRVIILTGSKKDHLQEDSKYFLVIKKKDLNDSFKRLNEVIKNNENIDELHNELADLKDQI
jgi:predicted ATP-grasp superfamily ATP-dependent carboligase